MWVLIVSMCMSIGEAPACVSEIYPVALRTFAECEDAAVISHDHIRAAADADNIVVVSLETHCFRTVGQPISVEGHE
ncbi:MAG: hypothetical protein CML03_14110 [Pseudooceanicola sp.]|nr:hypothetical protein [Pseudooceanicola sp.]|tara:strand:- start:330 stop:560 length:231 start_codon:yes stop_codon:yes gene_type:complete